MQFSQNKSSYHIKSRGKLQWQSYKIMCYINENIHANLILTIVVDQRCANITLHVLELTKHYYYCHFHLPHCYYDILGLLRPLTLLWNSIYKNNNIYGKEMFTSHIVFVVYKMRARYLTHNAWSSAIHCLAIRVSTIILTRSV